jgi:hypothetical protein
VVLLVGPNINLFYYPSVVVGRDLYVVAEAEPSNRVVLEITLSI